MRWFKHMTRSHADEFLAEVLDVLGLEGYGCWFIILEMIAEEMDETCRTFARFHRKTWARNCRISPRKWLKFAEFFQEKGKISLEISGEFITVDCPKLLEYRDEWSRRKRKNSGVTPECKRRNSGAAPELLTEVDKEEERDSPPYSPPSREKSPPTPEPKAAPEAQPRATGPPRTVPGYSLEFLQFWEAYPKQVGQDDAWLAWCEVCARLDFPGLSALLAALGQQEEGEDWRRDGGRYIPSPAKWLRSGRWKDRPPRAKRPGAVTTLDEWAKQGDASGVAGGTQ